MKALIVVADAGRARIFKAEKKLDELTEMEDLIHAESRLTNRELGADVPVRSANMKGSLEPRTFPKDYEEKTFAKQLGKHLKELHNKDRYKELILIASPRFLGMLRDELDKKTGKLVTRSIGKDLIRSSINDLAEYLKNN